MAPKLTHFPDEVLGMILGTFCLHCTREHDYDAPDGYFRPCKAKEQDPDSPSWYSQDYPRTLHSLCLVSRRFLSIAQPLLHHDFLPGYGDSWWSTTFSWDRRLSALLRTIVRRRDLAASVKRIFVHRFLFRQISQEEARSALDDAARVLEDLDVAEYYASFHATSKEYGSLGQDALGLLGVVLALVPNIDRLGLQVDGYTGGIPAVALQSLTNIVPGPGLLSRIKTLDICCHSAGKTLFSLWYAGGILEEAHGLETLNLHMCGDGFFDDSLRIGEDRLHLRHLRLTQSSLTDHSFGALLSACAPGLETIVYEASYPFWQFVHCDGITTSPPNSRQPTDPLFRHLVKFEATLKSLYLDLRCRERLTGRHGPLEGWEGGWTYPLTGTDTLASFSALEDVFLNTSLIYSPEQPVTADLEMLTRFLPPNVRTLKLAGGSHSADQDRLAKSLLHLAKVAAAATECDDRFSRLERVTCDASIAQELDEMAVREVFATAGIDFAYDSWSLSEPTVPSGTLRWEEMDYGCPSVPMPLPPDDEDDDL
ncbi:hypothetical protein VPNG_08886 [Cytospora leucostoma]|uniref:F-box domain-containing protein n=1 Tax=Cytospora leucostoma TaxID=1230097 RepID=A0A423VWW2_9PEZI|nr:hypothetical protein VPNG_08886 [Cytospora leucostoma]